MKSWTLARLAAFVEVLHSPEVAFTRNLSGPSFLIPLLLLGALSASVSLLQSPIELNWAERQLEARGVPEDQVTANLAALRRFSTVGAAVVPGLLLVKWVLLAALLWLGSQVVLAAISFDAVLNLVAFAHLPLVLRDAAIYAVLRLRDPETLTGGQALTVPIGLNLLFPSIQLPWAALAANVNVFELWYAALLVIGLTKLGQARWQRACAVVIPTWLFIALLQVAIAALGLTVQSSLAG